MGCTQFSPKRVSTIGASGARTDVAHERWAISLVRFADFSSK